MLLLSVLFLSACSVAFGQYSWCDPELCGGSTTVRHIACQNYGAFHPRCYPDSSLVSIRGFKNQFLHEHNRRRNLIASGKLPGYYPAARMATMIWDDELEYLAALNVRTCVLDHDDCNHTYRFKNCGQNLCAISRSKFQYLNVSSLVEQTVYLWFDTEFQLIDNSFVTEFKVTKDFEAYGHFTEMIVDRNTHVGCAILQFTRPDYPYAWVYNVVCNYASVYALGVPLYKVGRSGSECTTGVNPRYPALCSVKEVFDPNY